MAVIGPTTITTAVTLVASASVSTGTGGAGGVFIQTDFVYGSGGTSGTVWVQTSLDGGTTWIDVCSMSFLLASKSRIQNVNTYTSITTPYTPTDGTLAADSVHDGVAGTLWRTKLTTVGTYAGGTTIQATVVPSHP